MKNLFLIVTPYISLLLFTGIVMYAIGCQKDKSDPLPYPLSELPPKTTTGKNTLGFLLNDKPWVPEIRCVTKFPINKLTATFDTMDQILDINAVLIYGNCLTDYTYQILEITIADPVPGSIDFSKLKEATLRDINQQAHHDRFELDTLAGYSFNLTKWDLPNKIVSGIFEITVKNKGSDLRWKLSEGRFDIKFELE